MPLRDLRHQETTLICGSFNGFRLNEVWLSDGTVQKQIEYIVASSKYSRKIPQY